MLSDPQRNFVNKCRVARLATVDERHSPHLVPVCYCLLGANLYITVDQKPKRTDIPLRRLRNIQENPQVAVTVDHWDEDWSQLAWVMLRGEADILTGGPEHSDAQFRLRQRYVQYQSMTLSDLPVIAVRIRRVLSWGRLS
jgi:PPOX class probable F420-dependent enzyme